jgi:hypothetical protein
LLAALPELILYVIVLSCTLWLSVGVGTGANDKFLSLLFLPEAELPCGQSRAGTIDTVAERRGNDAVSPRPRRRNCQPARRPWPKRWPTGHASASSSRLAVVRPRIRDDRGAAADPNGKRPAPCRNQVRPSADQGRRMQNTPLISGDQGRDIAIIQCTPAMYRQAVKTLGSRALQGNSILLAGSIMPNGAVTREHLELARRRYPYVSLSTDTLGAPVTQPISHHV